MRRERCARGGATVSHAGGSGGGRCVRVAGAAQYWRGRGKLSPAPHQSFSLSMPCGIRPFFYAYSHSTRFEITILFFLLYTFVTCSLHVRILHIYKYRFLTQITPITSRQILSCQFDTHNSGDPLVLHWHCDERCASSGRAARTAAPPVGVRVPLYALY